MPRNRGLKGTDSHPRDTGSFVPYIESFGILLEPSERPMQTCALLEKYIQFISLRSDSLSTDTILQAKSGFPRAFRIYAVRNNIRESSKPRGYFISVPRLSRTNTNKGALSSNIDLDDSSTELFIRKFIDKKVGFGVFASRNLTKGVKLVEYEGQWISMKEHEKRELYYAKNGYPPVAVYDKMSNKMLDANRNHEGRIFQNGQNLARYFNHSKKSPNCKLIAEIQDKHLMDITFLIDDDYASPPARSYADDIPEGGKAYKLFPDKIRADILKDCSCNEPCNGKLMKDPYIVQRIQHKRSEYFDIPQGSNRTAKSIMMIRNSLIRDEKKVFHNFEGHIICIKKWTHIIGISMATYYRAMNHIHNGFYDFETYRKPTCSNVKGLDACGFIDNCLTKYGDYSPEREKILMPPCVNKKFIFDEYLENQGPHLKIKRFYQLFNQNFGRTVSFAKHRNINPCDICLRANNELHKLQSDLEKQHLKADLKLHLDRQSSERQDYYRKKREAIVKPNEVISIIIDGMDQGKTSLPHFRGWCRAKSAVPAIKTHITGAMVHGKRSYFFLDLLQWPHDPNLTLTCLLNTLTQACTGSLPPRLYLQCDNCGRENKNKFVIGFLAYLCHTGYLREVFLSFLLKGHTHEDIDQQFSKISHHLRTINVMTLPELEHAITESFTHCNVAEVLGTVFDIKTWISDYLNDMQNHSYPHQFWIYCDHPGHVTLKTRMWSSDSWTPEPEAPQLEIFKLDALGNQMLPAGTPGICLPNYEKINLQLARAAVEKCKIHLSFEEYNWWIAFFQDPHKSTKKGSSWPLRYFRKGNRALDIPTTDAPDTTEPRNTCITALINSEQNFKEVVTNQRKKRH